MFDPAQSQAKYPHAATLLVIPLSEVTQNFAHFFFFSVVDYLLALNRNETLC